MGVMMQAFHWDCPRVDNRKFAWWTLVRDRVPSLATSAKDSSLPSLQNDFAGLQKDFERDF